MRSRVQLTTDEDEGLEISGHVGTLRCSGVERAVGSVKRVECKRGEREKRRERDTTAVCSVSFGVAPNEMRTPPVRTPGVPFASTGGCRQDSRRD